VIPALQAAVRAVSRLLVAAMVLAVRAYQVAISPLLGAHCRFIPSCSQYAVEAFQTHGVWRGLYLATRRILRCHPYGGHGYDPVPPRSDRS
jgi:uncharacterized protein